MFCGGCILKYILPASLSQMTDSPGNNPRVFLEKGPQPSSANARIMERDSDGRGNLSGSYGCVLLNPGVSPGGFGNRVTDVERLAVQS